MAPSITTSDHRALHQLIAVTVQLDRAIRRFETEAWLLLQSVCLGFRHDAALKLVSA